MRQLAILVVERHPRAYQDQRLPAATEAETDAEAGIAKYCREHGFSQGSQTPGVAATGQAV